MRGANLSEEDDLDKKIKAHNKLWRAAGKPRYYKDADLPKMIRARRVRMAKGAGAAAVVIGGGALAHHLWKKRKQKNQSKKNESFELDIVEGKSSSKQDKPFKKKFQKTAKDVLKKVAYDSEGAVGGFGYGMGSAVGGAVGLAAINQLLKKKKRAKIFKSLKQFAKFAKDTSQTQGFKSATDYGKGALAASALLGSAYLINKAQKDRESEQQKPQRGRRK